MHNSTMILKGQLIRDGTRFLWWILDGTPSTVTVSHPVRGTRTAALDGDAVGTARRLADELLDDGGLAPG